MNVSILNPLKSHEGGSLAIRQEMALSLCTGLGLRWALPTCHLIRIETQVVKMVSVLYVSGTEAQRG